MSTITFAWKDVNVVIVHSECHAWRYWPIPSTFVRSPITLFMVLIYLPGRWLIVLFYLIGILLFVLNLWYFCIVPSHLYFTFLLIGLKYAWGSIVFSIKIVAFDVKIFQCSGGAFTFQIYLIYYRTILFEKRCETYEMLYIFMLTSAANHGIRLVP